MKLCVRLIYPLKENNAEFLTRRKCASLTFSNASFLHRCAHKEKENK